MTEMAPTATTTLSSSTTVAAADEVIPATTMKCGGNNGAGSRRNIQINADDDSGDGSNEKPRRYPLTTFADRYRVGEEIGSGKFAVVKRCVCTGSGAERAAKFIRKSRSGRNSCRGQKTDDIELEIAILALLLNHPNVIRLIDVFEDVHQVVLVFELMKGGELQDYIAERECLSEPEAKYLLRQILEALVYMHDHHIVHLDLKPENILLDDDGETKPMVKIIDFGISRMFDGRADIKGIYGTPEFIAPEILNYEPIGFGTDLWAVGCIAYNMLYGYSPFYEEEKQDTYTRITMVDYDFVVDCDTTTDAAADTSSVPISPAARDFIQRLLIKDIRKRMTARQCLQHEWLKEPEVPRDAAIFVKSSECQPMTVPTESPQRQENAVLRKRWKNAIQMILLYNRHWKRKLASVSPTTSGRASKSPTGGRSHSRSSSNMAAMVKRLPQNGCHSSRSSTTDGGIFDADDDEQDENFILAALFGAIEEGNLHSIEELFGASPLDPNQCNKHGESLLHYCAGLGQLEIFKFLLDIGADINVIDDQGDTVVHWAARQNHSNIIRFVYGLTATVEMLNKNHETPLHVAARYGHVEAVEQLCKCGANINAVDEHGETAILIAVWHGFPKIVHILGEIGADTNILNKEEESALHVASARGHYECVRCLLEAGANANLRNKNSYTPLHLALKRQHSLVAGLLLNKAGADYELADDHGERAIHYAARYNLVSICQWLCQPPGRCQVNVPNRHGLYPLHIAAKSGHIEIVRTLCLAGSAVDQKDPDSIIPQICAIAQSHNDIADLLTRLRNERQKEEFIGQLMPPPAGSQPLPRIKLKIFGHSGVGKSTLIESMKCGYFSSWFRRSRAPYPTSLKKKSETKPTNDSHLNGETAANNQFDAGAQTKGIDCQQAYISGVGDLSLWEFGGHPSYRQVYDYFIGDAHCLHAIVFRLSDPLELQLETIFYWLYFIQSRWPITEPLMYGGKSQWHAKIILIATHADLADQIYAGQEVIDENLRIIMEKVCKRFKDVFEIYGHIFMMDASVAGSAGMKQLKQYLAHAKQSVVAELPHTTGFLDSVLTFLNIYRKVSPNFPVLTYDQFKDMIRSQINPLSSDDHFKELVQQLDIMGEIVFLRAPAVTPPPVNPGTPAVTVAGTSHHEQQPDLLVLNPKWLNCDIVGTLLRMKDDPAYMLNLNKTRIMGIYSIDEFQERFPDVDALDLLQLLESLSVCVQNDRSGDIEYEFPCLTLAGDLDEVLDRFQYRDNCLYHGTVFHLADELSSPSPYGTILTSVFPRVQANLRCQLSQHPTYNPYDLHNCFKFSHFTVDDLMAVISLDTVHQSIDVRICGPYDKRRECFFFMQEMVNIVEQTLAKCLPGLYVAKSYLSPEQIKDQPRGETTPLSLYSSGALMKCLLANTAASANHKTSSLLRKKIRTDDGAIEERIADVICFGICDLTELTVVNGGDEPTLANELHSSNLSAWTKQKLCRLLDPPESIGRDWCMFGILLGMTDKLPKLDPGANAPSLSPTARVIEECVRNANCTIKMLAEKLTELNRFDCVDVIHNTGPLLRMFPLTSLPEEGIIYNDESSHTSLGVSTLSHTSSSNLSR